MNKFDEKAYLARYPKYVDRFASQEAFLDFIAATFHIRSLIVSSHDEDVNFTSREKPNRKLLNRINLAWAVQNVTGQGDTFWRVWTLLPNQNGELQVYYGRTNDDWWQTFPEYKITSIGDFIFKIEKG
jgi:hypothetical protein